MAGAATVRNDVFAANRAIGRVAFAAAAVSGASRRTRVREEGSLRVRFPNAAVPGTLEAVIVNTAGGMTGGDRFAVDVTAGPQARLTVTTAAAEKVYRSLGPDTEVDVRLDVGAGATLAWLPQETILFDAVRLKRSIEADVAPGGSLLLAEAIVFGRAAMGETVRQGRLFDRWRVRRDGALVFAETLALEGDIAEKLGESAVARGGGAVANVLKIPGDEQGVAQGVVAVRAMQDYFVGEVGVSAWNGLAAARLVAPDGAALRHDLVRVLGAFEVGPLPRLWTH